jgi:hypothetical protein
MIETLKKYDNIIKDLSVELFEEENYSYRLNASIKFINLSVLIIKDYVFNDNERKYSYHWMDSNDKMIFRWDNSEHWKNIETYPHHRHNGKTGSIECSYSFSLDEVMQEIKSIIQE